MKEKENTLFGMLDNVILHAPDEMSATLCNYGVMPDEYDQVPDGFPDRLRITFEWDATPTDQGLTSMDAHVAGMEPADVPAWMRDGSYVGVIGVVNGDSITARTITYRVANGLSSSVMAKE